MAKTHSASTTSLTYDTPGTERCPSCDRQFGPRAYDRHVEWCKEHAAYVHRSPAQVLLAKERLEARIKYRVPVPKSKRAIVKEKYSPGLGSRTESLNSIKSCAYLDQTPKARKPKSIVTLKKPAESSVYNHGDNVEITKRNENKKCLDDHVDTTNSATQPDYNPFLTAERQLMELLECDDFKPFMSKTPTTKASNRPHTVTGSKMRSTETNHNNNKFIKSAENTRKKNGEPTKRTSVIDPPTNFQDADDFELIESLINQNYLDDYDLMNTINVNTDKKFPDNYNDDSPTIDPRLINENDDLAFPDNLIVDRSSSNSSTDNLAPSSTVINKVSSSIRSSQRIRRSTTDKGFPSNNKATKSVPSNSKPTKSKKSPVLKPSVSLNFSSVSTNKKLAAIEIRKPLSLKKSLSVEESSRPKGKLKKDSCLENSFMSKNAQKELSSGDFTKDEDLFEVDNIMLEEFKKFEENYLKDKDEQRRRKEQELQETSVNFDNIVNSPVPKSNIDSAYNSLNRKNPKVRAKPNSLSPLEYSKPQVSPMASPPSSGSDTVSVIYEPRKQVTKFCHECGTKYPIITAKFCVECGVKRLVL